MSFVGGFMGGLAARAAVPVVAAAGYGAYQTGALENMPLGMIQPGPSHYEMSARVTGIERVCRLAFQQDGKLNRTTPMDCRRAVEALTQPVFRDYRLISTLEVDYKYYAPDGKTILTDSLTVPDDGGAEAYRLNGVIKIRVDAKNPRETEVI